MIASAPWTKRPRSVRPRRQRSRRSGRQESKWGMTRQVFSVTSPGGGVEPEPVVGEVIRDDPAGLVDGLELHRLRARLSARGAVAEPHLHLDELVELRGERVLREDSLFLPSRRELDPELLAVLHRAVDVEPGRRLEAPLGVGRVGGLVRRLFQRDVVLQVAVDAGAGRPPPGPGRRGSEGSGRSDPPGNGSTSSSRTRGSPRPRCGPSPGLSSPRVRAPGARRVLVVTLTSPIE